ncbi:hypothetical protein [Micromonospora sp. NBRC 101691]|uniref:hypothetical protein n=1 Tax=Micromonospora sp. NBRC 101691 TaxID=3032198 RepID=UPI0024A5F6B9|nr:hypothetical protein [Micromonospora sp. NBRC 101691]GLY20852.1 hypothetical protein Misp04_05840 [Micromonospora sp. NBRC 101691]
MPHGEAEHGCAQGDACRPGHQDQQTPGKHHTHRRSPMGTPHLAEPAVRPAEEDPPVPRQRTADCVDPEPARAASCRSDLPGWAGAHQHGPVRPSQRATRRERPPRRWC